MVSHVGITPHTSQHVSLLKLHTTVSGFRHPPNPPTQPVDESITIPSPQPPDPVRVHSELSTGLGGLRAGRRVLALGRESGSNRPVCEHSPSRLSPTSWPLDSRLCHDQGMDLWFLAIFWYYLPESTNNNLSGKLNPSPLFLGNFTKTTTYF